MAIRDISRYHGYHFLKLAKSNYSLLSSWPVVPVIILWCNIYIMSINTLAECYYIKLWSWLPNEISQSLPKWPKICEKRSKIGQKCPKILWPKLGFPTGRPACCLVVKLQVLEISIATQPTMSLLFFHSGWTSLRVRCPLRSWRLVNRRNLTLDRSAFSPSLSRITRKSSSTVETIRNCSDVSKPLTGNDSVTR